MLAPSFGLGLRDGALVILFFSLLTTLLPAYLCTLGPKTGMRQMVQARYSFGLVEFLLSLSPIRLLALACKPDGPTNSRPAATSSQCRCCSTWRRSRASASSWP